MPDPKSFFSSQRFAPRWSKFTVKSAEDGHSAIATLAESYKRIKAAIKAGEPTGYFSGGEPTATADNDQKEDPDQGNKLGV